MAPKSIATLALLAAASSLDSAAARYLQGNRIPSPAVEAVAEPPAADGPGEPSQTVDDEPPAVLPSHPRGDSLIAQQFTSDPHAGKDKLAMITNGELGLAGIRYMPTSFASGDDDVYAEVFGEFCAFDNQLNKQDPSRYPKSKDIMAASEHCGEHRYSIPLSEALTALEGSSMTPLPVSGLLFHQGHSGAGVVANALTAFDSALVVSEHEALSDALSACDVIKNRYMVEDCDAAKQARLVKDIITLLSRTADASVEHLFLKLDSASAAYLSTLTHLYPEAKWTFSYRTAEEALSKSMERKRNAVCTKARRNPSTALAEKSAEHNVDLEGLSRHEVCALHLSTLLEAATREHARTGNGLLVSYDDIASTAGNVIVDQVLPYLGLQGEMDSQVAEKVSEILSTRSDSRMGRGKEWDGTKEMVEITDEVRKAVRGFMGDLM